MIDLFNVFIQTSIFLIIGLGIMFLQFCFLSKEDKYYYLKYCNMSKDEQQKIKSSCDDY